MKDRKLAELDANDHINRLIAKLPSDFKATAAGFSPDPTVLKFKQVGYYYWLEDDCGREYGGEFAYPSDEVKADRLYYQIMIAHVLKHLSDLSNKNLCVFNIE